ncbi:MAG: phosphatidate cytidylyltransferase, partial [Campylobacter sp.]|nr:phosphatidate cytidylyltransferase [Campylobacter sp.]
MSAITSLFLWLLSVLVLASCTAYALRLKFGTSNSVISNLSMRINAWWVMILTIFAFAYLGKNAIITLFLLVSFAALREFLSLIYIRRGDHIALVACFYVILPLQYLFIYIDWYSMAMIFIPVYAFLFLPILSALSGDPAYFLERSTKIQWALMICVFCISHIPLLLTLDIEGFGGNEILLALFLILIVQSSDVLQYIWGKLFGKTKIAPSISPSKTVVGFVGGVGSASVLAAILHSLTPFSAM